MRGPEEADVAAFDGDLAAEFAVALLARTVKGSLALGETAEVEIGPSATVVITDPAIAVTP
jgi:hypothetical protein